MQNNLFEYSLIKLPVHSQNEHLDVVKIIGSKNNFNPIKELMVCNIVF